MPVLLAGHPAYLDSTVWDFEVKAVEVVMILGRGVLHWTRLSYWEAAFGSDGS